MPKKAPIAAVVLAAGKGTRMKSRVPKVLHPCCELPLVVRVVKSALARGYGPVVVVIDPAGGRVRDVLTAHFPDAELVFAVQKEQKGTGDALRAGLSAIPKFSGLLVTLYGDVPLLRPQTLSRLEKSAGKSMLSLLTARVSDPTGYGRVVQEGQQVQRIVEHKDATAEELQIDDINVGVYCADVELYRETVKRLKSDNQQKELYLTDVVEIASGRGPTRAVRVEDPDEIRGINTRVELAEAERTLRGWLVEAHQRNGVTFRDPASVILSENVSLGRDVLVGAGVQFYGTVKVGAGSRIEGPTVIKNAELAGDVKVEAFSHVEGAKLGRSVTVGPYARIRPDSQLDEGSRVGNFVELKKTRLGKGAKANHLSYLGDASIGADSNVGAGTITCNYDGFRKHQTRLGKNVFVGSNSTLVAPVNVGNDGYVGAGSVVTEDVPGGTLALGRSRQTNKRGYAKRLREKLKKE